MEQLCHPGHKVIPILYFLALGFFFFFLPDFLLLFADSEI